MDVTDEISVMASSSLLSLGVSATLALVPLGTLTPAPASWSLPRHAPPSRPRHASPLLQEPPFSLPYEVPPLPKAFSDYEWDPSFPGTFKPGTRGENQDLDDVLAEWEGRDNPACMQLAQDELWQVPLAPPEDILSWLSRIGLLEEEETGQEEESLGRGDSLLDDEFDLDDDSLIDATVDADEGGMDAM